MAVNMPVYLWSIKQKFLGLPALKEVNNFYVVNEELFHDYDAFKVEYDKSQRMQSLLLLNDLLLYMGKKGMKDNSVELFNCLFADFPQGEADKLYEWITVMRGHFSAIKYDAFK